MSCNDSPRLRRVSVSNHRIVGYGRANISFMFRQVKTDVPRTLFGWETGTLEIAGGVRLEPTPAFAESKGGGGFNTKKLEICTTDNSYKVPSSAARVDNANGSIYWDIPVEKVRLPVYNRYASAVVFEIGGGGVVPGLGADCDYVAMFWFKDIPDDEETEVRVPVVKTKHVKQLRQNYGKMLLPSHTCLARC